MLTYYAKFIFSKEIHEPFRSYLVDEFVKRRAIACDLLTEEFYAKVNDEFDAMYPGKDGYSEEYAAFISNANQPALDAANSHSIGLNLVRLSNNPEACGDIIGKCKMLNTSIALTLVPEKEEV